MIDRRSGTEIATLILMLYWVFAPGPPVLLTTECLADPALQGRSQKYSPGELESFLATHKGATILQHELGHLTGRDRATLTALIAWAPAEPNRKFTGVRIRLQKDQDGPEESVYLDASGLECADRIQSLAARREQIVERFRARSPSQSDWSEVIFVNNRKGSDIDAAVSVTALNVGWYRMGNDFGVVMRSLPTSREYLFPGAQLTSLAGMVSAARSYLQSPDPPLDREPSESESPP